MKYLKHVFIAGILALGCHQAAAEKAAGTGNDFPSRVIAEYVFACMSSNGQSEIMLEKCSCSIDVIAKMMSYEQYLEAETVLRMRQLPGERAAVFRQAEWANRMVENFNRAQAEAETQCF